VTAAYRSSYFSDPDGPAVASARAGNVIGGGDWAEDRLIPDLVRGALDGRSVVIRNPDAVRPWQHVLNPLAGYLLLAERLWEAPELAGAFNFGPPDDDARPVGWIAYYLRELWGPGLDWEARPDPDAVHEAHYLTLDSSKARTQLGWQAPWDLPAGLEALVGWFRAFAAGEPMREVSLAQIEAFESAS
jgi:CDP-glucose 4,6-dehydratase